MDTGDFLSRMWRLLLFFDKRVVTQVSFDLESCVWLVPLWAGAGLEDGNELVAWYADKCVM
jgi:hypothetical protein